MGNLCCSSRREKNASSMAEKEYPKWEKDDFNTDGSQSKDQKKVEEEI